MEFCLQTKVFYPQTPSVFLVLLPCLSIFFIFFFSLDFFLIYGRFYEFCCCCKCHIYPSDCYGCNNCYAVMKPILEIAAPKIVRVKFPRENSRGFNKGRVCNALFFIWNYFVCVPYLRGLGKTWILLQNKIKWTWVFSLIRRGCREPAGVKWNFSSSCNHVSNRIRNLHTSKENS